ncbi:MAG: oligosaccharide flippase family protein, partial [Syntrophomonadaceae bacterium]|nr:oligosaccharide flippase family protein [Syntrophomonadaceae bacterium]
MTARRPLVQGTVIQASVNLYNRLLGIISQALVIRVLGTEGYGLYQLSVPIFLLALVLATAGIPLAVTKVVAYEGSRGNFAGIRSIMRWSLIWLLLLGTVLSILLALLWPLLVRYWVFDPRAHWCILVLGLSLPVIATASALRGYFQGIQRMEIPALAQMFEQSVRVGSGLYLAHLLLPFGITWATAGYAAGVLLGELSGLLLLTFFYLKSSRRSGSSGLKSHPLSLTIPEKIAPFAAPAT